MPRTPSSAVRAVLGLSNKGAAKSSKGKRRKDLVEARTPKGSSTPKTRKTGAGKSPRAQAKQPRKKKAAAAASSSSSSSSAKGYRLHPVSDAAKEKWGPLSEATLNHMEEIVDQSLRVILNSASRTHSRDAEVPLLELRDAMLEDLRDVIAPLPPKRRRLGFAKMEEKNRRDEETLFETHRQVKLLEAEVDEHRRAVEEDEARLEDYEADADAAADRRAKQLKDLHPLLRGALKGRSAGAAAATGVEVRVPEWGGAADSDGDDDDDDDDDVADIARRLRDRLAGAEGQMARYREWLSVTHDLAASLAQDDDGAPG